ncbi:MAG: hypothetical protein MJE68_14365, partial [Proteobacteria bacterium]|nr:hypothetical protein [Pseudomonadota bacterium]
YMLRIVQGGLLALQIVHFYSACLWFIGHTDVTAYAQAQHWKGSSSHKTLCCNTIRYSGYTEQVGYLLYRALVITVMISFNLCHCLKCV